MKYMKEINQLAIPILCNYVLTTIFEVFDEVIIGHYSINGFALVGIAASIIYVITGAVGILSSIFNILAAKKRGMNDSDGLEELFHACKGLCILVGVGICLIGICFGKAMFKKMYKFEGENLILILQYFYPALITILQNLLIFQYSAYFRNVFNSKISMYVTAVSTVINLFFDYALVYGKFGFPEIGVAGAAWGSVIGLFSGLLIYQYKYYRNGKVRRYINIKYWKEITKLYPALFGQELIEESVFIIFLTTIISRLGTSQMAIYKLLDVLCGTIGLPAFAYASASQTYAIQQYSAKNKKQILSYLNMSILCCFGITSILCMATIIWKSTVFSWIINDLEIVLLSQKYLIYIVIYLLTKVPYYIYMYYLQGIERESVVLRCTLFGTLFCVGSIFLFSAIYGLKGIYIVMIVENLMLSFIYRHICMRSIKE